MCYIPFLHSSADRVHLFFISCPSHKTSFPPLWPQWLSGKESACNAGDTGDAGLIPGLGRAPGKGNGNPLQYSCLGNPMDRGAWQAIVHGFTKHWTRLSTHTCISLDTTGKARSMEHNLGTAGIRATRTFGFWIS